MDCTFSLLNKTQLHKIQALWEELNNVHLHDSIHFKHLYENFTFKQRCENFSKFTDDTIRIEVIQDNDTSIGYCISTIDTTAGEIDSIFIDPAYRKYGFGTKLVENSLAWFTEYNCRKIVVAVAAGHESVFAFYQKFGLYPKMTYLQSNV